MKYLYVQFKLSVMKGKYLTVSVLVVHRENGCQREIYYIFQVLLSVTKYNLYDCLFFQSKSHCQKYVWGGKNCLKTNVSQRQARLFKKKKKQT